MWRESRKIRFLRGEGIIDVKCMDKSKVKDVLLGYNRYNWSMKMKMVVIIGVTIRVERMERKWC